MDPDAQRAPSATARARPRSPSSQPPRPPRRRHRPGSARHPAPVLAHAPVHQRGHCQRLSSSAPRQRAPACAPSPPSAADTATSTRAVPSQAHRPPLCSPRPTHFLVPRASAPASTDLPSLPVGRPALPWPSLWSLCAPGRLLQVRRRFPTPARGRAPPCPVSASAAQALRPRVHAARPPSVDPPVPPRPTLPPHHRALLPPRERSCARAPWAAVA